MGNSPTGQTTSTQEWIFWLKVLGGVALFFCVMLPVYSVTQEIFPHRGDFLWEGGLNVLSSFISLTCATAAVIAYICWNRWLWNRRKQ